MKDRWAFCCCFLLYWASLPFDIYILGWPVHLKGVLNFISWNMEIYDNFCFFSAGFPSTRQQQAKMGNCVSSPSQVRALEQQAASTRDRGLVAMRKVWNYLHSLYLRHNFVILFSRLQAISSHFQLLLLLLLICSCFCYLFVSRLLWKRIRFHQRPIWQSTTLQPTEAAVPRWTTIASNCLRCVPN